MILVDREGTPVALGNCLRVPREDGTIWYVQVASLWTLSSHPYQCRVVHPAKTSHWSGTWRYVSTHATVQHCDTCPNTFECLSKGVIKA